MDRKIAKVKEWVARPYGRKHVLMESDAKSIVLLQIDPLKNTGIGADPKDTDKDGLRGHPGTAKETIRVLAGRDLSLKYSARDRNDGDFYTLYYGPGTEFESVSSNGEGYYHNIENISKSTILELEVTTIKDLFTPLNRK